MEVHNGIAPFWPSPSGPRGCRAQMVLHDVPSNDFFFFFT